MNDMLRETNDIFTAFHSQPKTRTASQAKSFLQILAAFSRESPGRSLRELSLAAATKTKPALAEQLVRYPETSPVTLWGPEEMASMAQQSLGVAKEIMELQASNKILWSLASEMVSNNLKLFCDIVGLTVQLNLAWEDEVEQMEVLRKCTDNDFAEIEWAQSDMLHDLGSELDDESPGIGSSPPSLDFSTNEGRLAILEEQMRLNATRDSERKLNQKLQQDIDYLVESTRGLEAQLSSFRDKFLKLGNRSSTLESSPIPGTSAADAIDSANNITSPVGPKDSPDGADTVTSSLMPETPPEANPKHSSRIRWATRLGHLWSGLRKATSSRTATSGMAEPVVADMSARSASPRLFSEESSPHDSLEEPFASPGSASDGADGMDSAEVLSELMPTGISEDEQPARSSLSVPIDRRAEKSAAIGDEPSMEETVAAPSLPQLGQTADLAGATVFLRARGRGQGGKLTRAAWEISNQAAAETTDTFSVPLVSDAVGKKNHSNESFRPHRKARDNKKRSHGGGRRRRSRHHNRP